MAAVQHRGPRIFHPTTSIAVAEAVVDDDEPGDAPVLAVLGELDWQAGCTAEADGVACGWRRDPLWSFEYGGRRTVMCLVHIQRLLNGEPDWSRLRKTCQVAHDGEQGPIVCGRPGYVKVKVDAATEIEACQSHYLRFNNGNRGDDFTKPIRVSNAGAERAEFHTPKTA